MAEEQRFEAQETHRLCANNCGFFGSSSTMNLCSKCYRDYRLKEEQASEAKAMVEATLNRNPNPSPTIVIKFDQDVPGRYLVSTDGSPFVDPNEPPKEADLATPNPDDSSSSSSSSKPNRCSTCRKKVGLTGFKCRCGVTFCSSHRYPESHDCSFDFKQAGKDAIAKANPVVKGDKVQRI